MEKRTGRAYYEFPLRKDFLAQVIVPSNLTSMEAKKLCDFVMTLGDFDMVKRYDLYNPSHGLELNYNGYWVPYDDYQKLQKALEEALETWAQWMDESVDRVSFALDEERISLLRTQYLDHKKP